MPDYATLYLANSSPLPLEFLQRMAPHARVSTLPPGEGIAGGYLIETPAWRMRLGAMPAELVGSHLTGFSGWIQTVGAASPHAPGLQQHLGETKLVVGCVAEPAFDPNGYARRTIAAIARPGRGLIFANNAVYDADGMIKLGAPGSPARFVFDGLSPPQRWTLATTAIVTRYFEHRHDLLGGMEPGAESRDEARNTLLDPWEIGDRRQLLDMLKHLGAPEATTPIRDLAAKIAAGTARPSDDTSEEDIEFVRTFGPEMGERARVADYLCRRVYVAGLGYLAGFLSESEAWGFALAAAHRLQSVFQSWEDLGASYLMGVAWRRGADEDLEQAYHELLADAAGPWRVIAWNTPLA